MKQTIIGVDLAKDVIQVCIYSNKRCIPILNDTERVHFLAYQSDKIKKRIETMP